MATYKSKVLNLWDDSETLRMRILPEATKVRMFYDNGSLPVEFPNLETQGENVYQKMSANAQAVLDEQSRAQSAEAAISANLTTESNRALSAEAAIQLDLDNEKSRIASRELSDASERAAEQSARILADNLITNNLNNEITDRQAQDAQHTLDISNEQIRATNEEERIEEKLDLYQVNNDARSDNIESAHSAYVSSNNARLDAIEAKAVSDDSAGSSALQAEIDTRVSEVARLDDRINNVLSNIDPASLDSLTEIVNKFNQDGVTYADRLTALEAVVAALVEQLGA